MRSIALALAFVASVAAADAPTNLGKTRETRHVSVVSIAPDRPGGIGATGLLIQARVVLTAGHVIGRENATVGRVIAFGADLNDSAAPHLQFATVAVHRSIADLLEAGASPNEQADFYDLGLVFLGAPARGARPVGLPAPGVLATLASSDRLVAMGYGVSRLGLSGPASADGFRWSWRVGVSRLLNPAWLRIDDDPVKGFGQLCHGDSGAPILLERGGVETVVALISHADSNGCGAGVPTYALRLDAAPILAWIRAEAAARGITIP